MCELQPNVADSREQPLVEAHSEILCPHSTSPTGLTNYGNGKQIARKWFQMARGHNRDQRALTFGLKQFRGIVDDR